MPKVNPLADSGNSTILGPRRAPTWRVIILVILTVLCLGAFYYSLLHPAVAQQEMTQAQLFDLIKQGRVTNIVNEPDPATGIRTLVGTYTMPASTVLGVPVTEERSFRVAVDLALGPYLAREIQQAGYKGDIETRNNQPIFWPLVINFLPILLFVGLMVLFVLGLARFLLKLRFGPHGT